MTTREKKVSVKSPMIIGNWKMYKTIEETLSFIQEVAPQLSDVSFFVGLAVPYTAISAAKDAAKEFPLFIGAQNMNDVSEGAFTGEIAGIMLKSCGAEFVLLGHSERRTLFHETDAFINRKVLKALQDELKPILCIGETSSEREEKKTEEVLKRQLFEGLAGVSKKDAKKIVIAYEPIWAIGTGKSATPKMAEEAHAFIRTCLEELFGKSSSKDIPLLYGGSVKPDNIKALMKEPDIDGALVGGASLQPQSFLSLIHNV